MPFEFQLDPRQEAILRALLTPKQYDQAIYQIVSRTTNRARKIAGDYIAARMPIPRKYIDSKTNRYAAIKTRVVRGTSPVGVITVKYIPLPLAAFPSRQTPNGAIVTVDKANTPWTLKHGFIAKVKSQRQEEQGISHKGIFLRAKVRTGGDNAVRYFQKNRTSHARTARRGHVTPAGYAWRLPIKEYFGPAVLDFMERDEILEPALRDIGKYRDQQVDSQLSRFTKGRYSTIEQAAAVLEVIDTGDDAAPTNDGD